MKLTKKMVSHIVDTKMHSRQGNKYMKDEWVSEKAGKEKKERVGKKIVVSPHHQSISKVQVSHRRVVRREEVAATDQSEIHDGISRHQWWIGIILLLSFCWRPPTTTTSSAWQTDRTTHDDPIRIAADADRPHRQTWIQSIDPRSASQKANQEEGDMSVSVLNRRGRRPRPRSRRVASIETASVIDRHVTVDRPRFNFLKQISSLR